MLDLIVDFFDEDPTRGFLVFGFILLIAWSTCWVVSSSFEASAFKRVTGKSVSTWDAMFLDLRVLEVPSK